jgi:hypothetical protein
MVIATYGRGNSMNNDTPTSATANEEASPQRTTAFVNTMRTRNKSGAELSMPKRAG